MNPSDAELLRSLASGVRRPGLASATPSHRGLDAREVEGASFQTLLEQARAGRVSSGLPVTIARGAGVELSDKQLEQVAAAADLAQASGAARALVMIEGKALKLDVGVRSITGVADLSAGKVVTGIDAVIQVPGGSAAPPMLVEPPGAAKPNLNVSLLRALRPREDRAAE